MAHKAHRIKETEIRELREEDKRFSGEGRTSLVQFEEAGEEGRFEEDRKMEVDEKVDTKRKLNQRKKELQIQFRDIERFTGRPQDIQDLLWEKWQHEPTIY